MALLGFIHSLSSASSLSPFDPKHDSIDKEYYYDPILREYIILNDAQSLKPCDSSSTKPKANMLGTPATSIIHRQSFESSPIHIPLDAFLSDDSLDYTDTTINPATSIFDHEHMHAQEDVFELFGSNRLSVAWEGYQTLLNGLRTHRERIYLLRSPNSHFSGDTLCDIPGAHLMEWLVSHFQNSEISLFPDSEIEGLPECPLRASILATTFATQEEVVCETKRGKIRKRVHGVASRFVFWFKTVFHGLQ